MSTVATNKLTLCIQLRRVVEIFSSMIEMRKRQFERNLNDPRMILQLFSSVWRDNMNNKCNLRIYTVVHFNSFDKKTICDVNTLEAGWHHTVFSRHSSPNLYTITSLFKSYIKHRGQRLLHEGSETFKMKLTIIFSLPFTNKCVKLFFKTCPRQKKKKSFRCRKQQTIVT